jgi:hypothetical protein
MKLVHLTSTVDGGSRFAEMEIRVDASPTPSGAVLNRSDIFPMVGSMIMELPEGLILDWHTSPRPSFVVVLSGAVESETSDGAKRSWGAGEMFFTDDRDGRGHRTRTVDGSARLLFLYPPNG